MRISGISPHAGIAIEHGVLFTILTLMICYDLLNVLNLASAEQAARRILMIERAVRRSPKSPDFEGLDVLLSNQFDSTGGVLTRHCASVPPFALHSVHALLPRKPIHPQF